MSRPPHCVRLADCAALPWRNGGGVTRELLAWPADAPVWEVRVSVADIDRDGPFSSFPGIDRCFAVLQGAGVELGLPGGLHRQRPTDTPVVFSGDTALDCRLVDGPTRDLNLMGRRSAGRVTMRRASTADRLDAPHAWRALFTFARATLDWGGPTPLTIDTAALLWAAGPQPGWQLLEGQHAFWLTFDVSESMK